MSYYLMFLGFLLTSSFCLSGCFPARMTPFFSLCLVLALYDFLQHSALAWLRLWVTHSLCLALFPPPSCLLDICSVLPNSNVACLKMKPCSVPLYSKNHPSLESWASPRAWQSSHWTASTTRHWFGPLHLHPTLVSNITCSCSVRL